MTNSKYNQLIPDEVIDTLYKQIGKCINDGTNYDHFMKVFDTLNGGVTTGD